VLNEESRARLLVVDDERPLRALLVRWLSDAGYDCVEAATSEEAWARLLSEEVHLLTLDVTMPGMSGLELVEKIGPAFPDAQILMVTASGDATSAIQALTRGANAYLVKPVERNELLHHVERGLERRRLMFESRRYMQELECRISEQTLVIRQAHEETIHRLVAASGYRDEETGGHVPYRAVQRSVGACGWLV